MVVCIQCSTPIVGGQHYCIQDMGQEIISIIEQHIGYELSDVNDEICPQCLAQATQALSTQDAHIPAIEQEYELPPETDLCVWCRSSLSYRWTHAIPQGAVRNHIAERIYPRQIPPGGLICYACWLHLRQTVANNAEERDNVQQVEEVNANQCVRHLHSLARRRRHSLPAGPVQDEIAAGISPRQLSDDLEAPAALKVCRICLAMNTKLYSIRDVSLYQAYVQVMCVTIGEEDKLPQKVCWECAQRLRNCSRFKAKALRSQGLMMEALLTSPYLSIRNVQSIRKTTSELKSSLKSKYYKPNDYYIHDNQVTVESETENGDDDDDWRINDDVPDDASDDVEELEELKKDELVNDQSDDQVPHIPPIVEVEMLEVKDEQNNDIFFSEYLDDHDFNDSDCDKKLSEVLVKKKVRKKKTDKKARVKVKRTALDEEFDPNSTLARYKKEIVKRRKTQGPLDETLFTITTMTYEEQIAEVEKRQEMTSYKTAPFKCTICYRGFLAKDRYDGHLVKHSEANGAFECFICKTRLKTAHALRKHLTAQHTKKFVCKGCPFVTRHRGVAREHEKWHSGTRYQCPHCPSDFDYISTYRGHIRIKHVSDFVCELCGYIFVSGKGIEVHKKKKHRLHDESTPLEGPYCEVCNVRFISDEAHTRHLKMSSKHITSDDDPNCIRNDSQSMNCEKSGRAQRRFERRLIIHPRDAPDRDRRLGPAGPVTCEQLAVRNVKSIRKTTSELKSSLKSKSETENGDDDDDDDLRINDDVPDDASDDVEELEELKKDELVNDQTDDQIPHIPLSVEVEMLEVKDEPNNDISEYLDDHDFNESDDDKKLSEVLVKKKVKKDKMLRKKKTEKKARVKVKRTDMDEELDPNSTFPRYKKEIVKRRKTHGSLDETLFTITTMTYEEQIAEVEKRQEMTSYKTAPFKCTICYRGYRVKDRYDVHLAKHNEANGAFECFICKSRLKTARALRKHLQVQHTKKFVCKECPFVTRNRNAANNHEKWHSGTRYQCPHCPSDFDNISTYRGHIRIKHISDFVCDLCGYIFVNGKGIEIHKYRKHRLHDESTPLEGPYCELCNVKFISDEAYTRHLKLSSKHITSDDDPNRVRNDSNSMYCAKMRGAQLRFERKPFLHPSARPDAPDRDRLGPAGPVTCEQCGIQLRDLRLYAQHFRTTHPDKNRTKYPDMKTPRMCEQCGWIFQSLALLKDHMRVHTGEKRFICDICEKSFTKKTNLVFHMRVHSATRPTYECPLCEKQFAFFNNVQRHMFIHTGIKPFKCDSCSKAFIWPFQLRLHVDRVHRNKPRPRPSARERDTTRGATRARARRRTSDKC